MESTTYDITELFNYHLEIFRGLFGESENLDAVFRLLWKNRLKDEVLSELVKRESKHFLSH